MNHKFLPCFLSPVAVMVFCFIMIIKDTNNETKKRKKTKQSKLEFEM